jgi:hypothetical protein
MSAVTTPLNFLRPPGLWKNGAEKVDIMIPAPPSSKYGSLQPSSLISRGIWYQSHWSYR